MDMDTPINSINGVGEVIEASLNKIGIFTIGNLINYYPRKYHDYSNVQKINNLKPGMVTIKARIIQIKNKYVRRGMVITEAIASDNTGSLRLIWFNQAYRVNSVKPKEEYFIRGDFGLKKTQLGIVSPVIELVSDFPIHSARIVPEYKLTKGLKSNQIRKILFKIVPEIKKLSETMPSWILEEYNLLPKSQAMEKLHFPDSSKEVDIVKKRLGFEELFQLSLASELNKKSIKLEKSFEIVFNEKIAKKFVESLSFKLTDAQKRAIWQILKDMENNIPMNRLIEGDVGSGKTVVACMVSIFVVKSGYQVAIMAPTEILARQHFDTFRNLLKSLKMDNDIELLVSNINSKDKKEIKNRISKGESKIIIGTSSLIQDAVKLNNLALVIVDEQHRFGVSQRKKLQSKANKMPHVLTMTATPIPRSLALTLYGELDITLIDEKPKNRLPIITNLVSPNSTKIMFDEIKQQLNIGHQVIVVCPLINENEEVSSNSVISTYENLKKGELSEYKVNILHGKQKAEIKDNVMNDFNNNKIQVLVTTTVIEVGVDVPNATVMVILSPERFGLAQMHQLRGRVGRSNDQSYCYVVLSDSKAPSRRIRAFASKSNGFELAELDLDIRGPGAIYGTLQHGAIDLRLANLFDIHLISAAKNAAKEFIEKKEVLAKYPQLNDNVNKLRKITNLN